MSKGNRIILIPRFGAKADGDWYKWLESQLSQNSAFEVEEWITCDLMPNENEPDYSLCRSEFLKILGKEKSQISKTILIGHSLGAQIALHSLASLDDGLSVRGVLCVAGWLKLDHTPDTLSDWMANKLDGKKIKSHADKIVNVISTNDPNQLDTVSVTEAWRDGDFGADVVLSSKPGHVSDAEEPDVLDTLLKYFA